MTITKSNGRPASAITPDDYARFERKRRAVPSEVTRVQDGATFALDSPEQVPAIWGDGENVAWAAGEPLMIAGPVGVGKTTLGQRLALLRSGVHGGDLLGMPVEVDARRVLYIAADRPRQIARSVSRMVSEADREGLRLALAVHIGPLPFDLGRAAPGQLVDYIDQFPEIGTVVIDSLKDVAVGLTDDETGGRINGEVQRLLASGREVIVLHHQRKATAENRRPRTLDDVYGSTWLVAGCGSVLLLWGRAGDPVLDLQHLKQPSGEVGPLSVVHEPTTGELRVHEQVDLLDVVTQAPGGITARDAAISVFATADPSRAEVQKARRRLDALVDRQVVERDEEETPTRYRRRA